MAPGTPCSAAYSNSMMACSVLPWRSACVPAPNASCGVGGIAERGGNVSGATIGAAGTRAATCDPADPIPTTAPRVGGAKATGSDCGDGEDWTATCDPAEFWSAPVPDSRVAVATAADCFD